MKNTAWVQSPLDEFTLAKMEAAGVAPSPPADKRTWLRRVTYDLIGLPPTPEEIAAFLAVESPTFTRAWSIDCCRPLRMANAGDGTGWMSHGMPIPRAG